jgi:hypothetical protein
MANVLDIRQFFRRSPREWLRRYFEWRGVLAGFDWTSLRPRDLEPLMTAWLALDSTQRDEMMADFANIAMLATPAGKMQIIDEAPFHGVEEIVIAKLAELEDIYACVYWLFLEQTECWNGAVFYAAADGKPKRYWRKRINMPGLGRLASHDDGRALAAAITGILRRREARGDLCVVHQYRRGGREYYFAYPLDHRQTAIEYDAGEMTKRPYNPAFEIIFIHDDAQRTLSIWHDGKKERVQDLQLAFAQAVLGQHIPRDSPVDEYAYDLDCILDPDFAFRPTAGLGISTVEVRKLGLRIGGPEPYAITIDLRPKTPAHRLTQCLNAVVDGIRPTLMKVARVGCQVAFEPEPGQTRGKTRSFELVWPNSCSLQNDSHGILIQRMLIDHGIEPRPRTDE